MAHGSPIPAQVPTSQGGQAPDVTLPQGIDGIPIIVNGQIIGWNIGGEFFTQEEVDALIATGKFPEEPKTGTGPSVPSFASTQAAQTQQEQFLQAQAARDAQIAEQTAAARVQAEQAAAEARRVFDEEQAEIDRELRLREARLATARDLVGIRSAEAREARTQGVSLAGDDPFRFTAIARGLAGPTGTTPSAAFKGNLAQAGNFQAPDLTGLDSNALESVIGKLSQSNVPQGGTLGFAHGGTIGAAGARPGDGSRAIEVGEAGPEILILRPDGSVEVVPKMGSAQFGGEFDLGGFTSLFRSLRQSTGLTGSVLEAGTDVRAPLLGVEASRLGAFQRAPGTLLTSPDTSTVFVIDETGALRPFTNNSIFQQSGFSGGDVQTIPAHQLAQFRTGAGISNEPFSLGQQPRASFQSFAEPLNTGFGFQDLARAVPGFSSQDANRIANLIGFLPAPFKIPASFFLTLLPAEKQALISAYRLAGVPQEDFNHLLTAPQLSFAPQRATAVG